MYIFSLWLPMGVFGMPVVSFGPTLGSLGSLWPDFGSLLLPWGDFRLPLVVLWGPFQIGPTFGFFGSSGVTLGSLWVSCGVPLAPIGLPRARPWPGRDLSAFGEGKVSFRVHETTVWDTEPDLPDLPERTEVVAASAPQTLPSTRAGGQDDVSSRQTPSN